jgi:hypothetical protein
LVFYPTVLDYNVLALDITGFTEALSKCGQIWLCASGSDTKKANHRHRWQLCTRRERLGGSGTNNSFDEIASSHCLKAHDRANYHLQGPQLQQGFAINEMGFSGQFARQQS